MNKIAKKAKLAPSILLGVGFEPTAFGLGLNQFFILSIQNYLHNIDKADRISRRPSSLFKCDLKMFAGAVVR
jgi:hypothetical protein